MVTECNALKVCFSVLRINLFITKKKENVLDIRPT